MTKKNIVRNSLLAGAVLAAVQLAGCDGFGHEKPGPMGHLSSVRSALQVYYGDTEGVFPESLDALTQGGKYLQELPKVKLPSHSATNEVLYLSGQSMDPGKLTDTGGYAYYNSKKYPETYGALIFNCTHKDAKERPLYSF